MPEVIGEGLEEIVDRSCLTVKLRTRGSCLRGSSAAAVKPASKAVISAPPPEPRSWTGY